MSDADLIAAFLAWREEIDSTPFAYEHLWSGDQSKETP